ncbi:integrase [Bifidobacterium leontopitheci]|uniref:Integrase n=1 Tax=Bifidobacterium leontopitheci TaxID=2650774 RepID=A0A6I1GPB1_9BIFI|nr:integrase [Bifidobacterium leontopitheci]
MLRNRALVTAIAGGEPVASAARRYGVSRQWAHTLFTRWRQEGETGLLPRSRAAHTIRNKTSEDMAARIVAMRDELDGQGLDAGAESIAARLERSGLEPPSNSTIHRILVASGRVVAEPRKRPKSSLHRFQAGMPNELWQSDFTHWPLLATLDALIVSWLDDHSRKLLSARSFRNVNNTVVEDTFHRTCAEHGVPAAALSDNGTEYTSRLVSVDPNHFERTLASMGVRFMHGRPAHPQTQGKIERYHRTLKKWLGKQPKATSLDELDAQLAEFMRVYNTERPHRALGRRTPDEAYAAKGKAGPDPELAERHRLAAMAEAERRERQEKERERERAARGARPRKTRRPPVTCGADEPERTLSIDRRGCFTMTMAGARRTVNTGKANHGRKVTAKLEKGRILAWDAQTGRMLVDQPLDASRDYQPRQKAGPGDG